MKTGFHASAQTNESCTKSLATAGALYVDIYPAWIQKELQAIFRDTVNDSCYAPAFSLSRACRASILICDKILAQKSPDTREIAGIFALGNRGEPGEPRYHSTLPLVE